MTHGVTILNPKTIVVWTILTGLLFSACQGPPETSLVTNNPAIPGRCAPTDVADVAEIIIGATAPLSEPGAAAAGQVMQTAFSLAVEDINAAGGVLDKPLKVIVRDTKGLPDQGTQVAGQLITQDCVVAIVGEYHSAVGLTIMEVAHHYRVPVIFAETYNDDITAAGYPEVFRIAPTSTFTAQMDANWLADVGDYNGNGMISAVVIAENTDYGVGQVDKAKTWFPEFGLTLEVMLVDLPIDDFSSVIDQIKALEMRPDAILVKVTGDISYRLQQQIIEAGLAPNNQTILVANQVALNHEAYWQVVPDGAFVVVPRIGPWGAAITKTGAEFAQRYEGMYDKWPEPYAFEAYDSVRLIADAISRAGSLDPDSIISALETADIELTSGHYEFPYGRDNPAGGYVPEFMWHQWPHVPLLFLQYTAPNQHSNDMAVIWPSAYRTTSAPVIRP
ncbi:MAG TPA: ABC transporter substrate-binding protein [Anaerolineae bacterium]